MLLHEVQDACRNFAAGAVLGVGEVPFYALIWRGILWHAMRFVPGTGIVVHVLPRLPPESPASSLPAL